MLKIVVTFHLSIFLLVSTIFAQQKLPPFFNGANLFFKKHVRTGLVDYSAIKGNPTEISKLVESIAGVDSTIFQEGNQEKAFLINTYNIMVINATLVYYPLKSVMDIDRFFDTPNINLAGRNLSLNQLEKEILFKKYPDPRLHFVLVCAARGCPQLIDQVYLPDRLDKQLDQRTRMTLNDDRYVRIDHLSNTVFISELFKWYAKDFTESDRTIIAYINQYRKIKIPADYRIKYISYDWRLNDFL